MEVLGDFIQLQITGNLLIVAETMRGLKFFFLFSFLNIYILLAHSWLTMFQVKHSKVIQLYIYIYNIFEIIFHDRLL